MPPTDRQGECALCGAEGYIFHNAQEAKDWESEGRNLLYETNRGEVVCRDYFHAPNRGECENMEEPPQGTVYAYDTEGEKERCAERLNHPPDQPVAKDSWERITKIGFNHPLTGVHCYDPEPGESEA